MHSHSERSRGKIHARFTTRNIKLFTFGVLAFMSAYLNVCLRRKETDIIRDIPYTALFHTLASWSIAKLFATWSRVCLSWFNKSLIYWVVRCSFYSISLSVITPERTDTAWLRVSRRYRIALSCHLPMHFNNSTCNNVIRTCTYICVRGTAARLYRCNYAKHRLMNAYGQLFGTKSLSLLYIKHEWVIYIVVHRISSRARF